MAETPFYTARQAQDRLGMTEGAFFYLVTTGKIKKYIPPGKRQGVYLKSEVDQFAREMLAFLTYDEQIGTQFSKLSSDPEQREQEMIEQYELATLLFGNAVHNMDVRRSWVQRNPEIDFLVRDQGRLVAFLNVLPATHDAIGRFLSGEIRGWDIPAEDVLPYVPGSRIEMILFGMATVQDVELSKRKQYGRYLISGFLRFLKELAQQNILITHFHATSLTPTGIAILDNAGFERVAQLGKRIAFTLNTQTSDSRLAREYRALFK